jgi:inhibitor of KinA
MHQKVMSLSRSLLDYRNKEIITISPGYSSVLVRLHNDITLSDGMDIISMSLKKESNAANTKYRNVDIPVCYDDEFCPDIKRVLEYTGYKKDEIIKRHTESQYLVYFIGFSAGFPYIGGMDPTLATPRLDVPRTSVPAGSVGIAGRQTGIYPLSTPGGWNLIGKTPIPLFDSSAPDNGLIQMGDRIRFISINRDEFETRSSLEQ